MATKQAVVTQVQGITFAGKADTNHWVIMDGPKTFGGSRAGSSPKELLLISLGGCTATDVVSILQKKRVPFTGFEIRLTADAREEHPPIFTDIHIEYVVYGDDVKAADVERAIELSKTKYCSVSAMLSDSVKMTRSYRIKPSNVQEKEQTLIED